MSLSWLYLFAAILFEVAGTMSMKLSEGFTKLLPSIMIFVFYAIAFTFVTLAIRKIEISVAYTVWSGIGVTLVALIGILYFGEQANAMKLASIGLVIAGVIGLRLSSS